MSHFASFYDGISIGEVLDKFIAMQPTFQYVYPDKFITETFLKELSWYFCMVSKRCPHPRKVISQKISDRNLAAFISYLTRAKNASRHCAVSIISLIFLFVKYFKEA